VTMNYVCCPRNSASCGPAGSPVGATHASPAIALTEAPGCRPHASRVSSRKGRSPHRAGGVGLAGSALNVPRYAVPAFPPGRRGSLPLHVGRFERGRLEGCRLAGGRPVNTERRTRSVGSVVSPEFRNSIPDSAGMQPWKLGCVDLLFRSYRSTISVSHTHCLERVVQDNVPGQVRYFAD